MPFGTAAGVLVAVGVGVLVGRGVAVGQLVGVGVLVGRAVAVGRGVGDGPGVAVGPGVRVGRGVRVTLGVAVGGCPAAQDADALAVVSSSQRMLKLTDITPPMLQPGATSMISWLPSGYVTVALAKTTCSQFNTQSSEIVDVSPSELQLVPNSGSPAALAAA